MTLESATGLDSARAFQFRLRHRNGAAQLSFIALEISSSNPYIEAPIPTTGPHAYAADDWYHVAATYDASGVGIGHMKLYWTKLSALPGEANELTNTTVHNGRGGDGKQLADIDGTAYFLVGNRWGTGGIQDEDLHGLVDEIRISSTVRGADEFIFYSQPVAEPGALPLIACALLGLRRRGRR